MAKLTQAITKDFLDDILPPYGTLRYSRATTAPGVGLQSEDVYLRRA